jgi:hypothetical protein
MTMPNVVVDIPNLVHKADGVVIYKAHQIMACFKEHYEGLFNYNPENVSYDANHWDNFDFSDKPQETIDSLSFGLMWLETLITIRGMNLNTAPRKDVVHVNVLKIMVLEECMALVKQWDPDFC